MTAITGLPPKVTATLADDGPDGSVFRLADDRGYTKVRDTVRIGRGTATRGEYAVSVWRREGWVFLLSGKADAAGFYPIGEAIRRAVAVLYGMEDHG